MTKPVPDPAVADTLGLDARPRRLKRAWWLAIPLAAALAAWGLWAGLAPTPVAYRTLPVRHGALVATVTATGTLQPLNSVDVGAEISGRIDSIRADFNDVVKKGDVLAVLNTDQLQARVRQSTAALASARAAVLQARATLEETRLNYARTRTLSQGSHVSQQELDSARVAEESARAGLAVAEAQVKSAQATLAADRSNLDKAVIRAPIDGIVISRSVEAGQTVAASFQTPVLFTLAQDLRRMELHVDVDEADVARVAEGQQATFTVDAWPDRHFPAVVTSLHNAARTVQGVVAYEAVLAVDNSDGLLRPGMTATAEITTEQRDDANLIPNAALRFTPPGEVETLRGNRLEPGTGRVWILRDDKPVAIVVRTGLSDGRETEMLGEGPATGTPLLVDVVHREPTAGR
ncbi:MAG: efflux RND transporter periplasmic adaptor subunit [Gammaproteobacteria bacterium]|jgi:HlyD family secretion protein